MNIYDELQGNFDEKKKEYKEIVKNVEPAN